MAQGGKRQKAGRKIVESPARNRTIRLNDKDYSKFLAKGGVKWLRTLLLLFVFLNFFMPAFAVPGYDPKTEPKDFKYYEAQRETDYLAKLRETYYKKCERKVGPDSYTDICPMGSYEKEVSNPYIDFCIKNGIYKDVSEQFPVRPSISQ